jgi:hypothetical protein
MTLPARTFGIELELTGIDRLQACQILRNSGFEAFLEDYNHRTQTYWKITTDSSVPNGFEIVSPILQGVSGLETVGKVSEVLRVGGATVDVSCGLHVHIGADDLNLQEIVTVLSRYASFEETIDSFMPRSRRGNNNRYCQSIRYLNSSEQEYSSFQSFIEAQIHGRYSKVNVQCWRRQHTIEFRQHSGSCNGTKIVNWIRFLLHFVENSKNLSPPLERPSPTEESTPASPEAEQQYGQMLFEQRLSANARRLWRRLLSDRFLDWTDVETVSRVRLSTVHRWLRQWQHFGVRLDYIGTRGIGITVDPSIPLINVGVLRRNIGSGRRETEYVARVVRWGSMGNIWDDVPDDLKWFYEDRIRHFISRDEAVPFSEQDPVVFFGPSSFEDGFFGPALSGE